MNKDLILQLIYSIITILVLFILKYLNKQVKSIKKEFSKEKLIINVSRNDSRFLIMKKRK